LKRGIQWISRRGRVAAGGGSPRRGEGKRGGRKGVFGEKRATLSWGLFSAVGKKDLRRPRKI